MQTTMFVAGLSMAVVGVLVLLISQSINVQVPDRIDIAKRVVGDLQIIQSNDISTAWKNAASYDLNSFEWSQQDLNALDMYQNAENVKSIEHLFGTMFLLLGSALSILSSAVEFIPKIFTN